MEYTPRYPQPFTLAEAIRLDASVIYEEITRLNNSIEHLKRSQIELREAVASDPDPELDKAIKENNFVIGSQEERVSILKMALVEKGITISLHFDGDSGEAVERSSTHAPAQQRNPTQDDHNTIHGVDDDGGIDL